MIFIHFVEHYYKKGGVSNKKKIETIEIAIKISTL